jgi:hypothetical protein
MGKFNKKWALKILPVLNEILFYSTGILFILLVLYLFLNIFGFIRPEELLEEIPRANGNYLAGIIILSLGVPAVLAGLPVFYQFRKIFKNLKKGEVFTFENARRFRLAALFSILSAILGLQIWSVFSALVVLLFAEIVRYGVELEEDKKLTV